MILISNNNIYMYMYLLLFIDMLSFAVLCLKLSI